MMGDGKVALVEGFLRTCVILGSAVIGKFQVNLRPERCEGRTLLRVNYRGKMQVRRGLGRGNHVANLEGYLLRFLYKEERSSAIIEIFERRYQGSEGILWQPPLLRV
jgi:hypothetical protein